MIFLGNYVTPSTSHSTITYPLAPKPLQHSEHKCKCAFPPYGYPGASPWFAPGGGPFPWAGGTQGSGCCGGPCHGNPRPCCGPSAPRPCCPDVPNCCQSIKIINLLNICLAPCCPALEVSCCPQQAACCDQTGCASCRSLTTIKLRTKRTVRIFLSFFFNLQI